MNIIIDSVSYLVMLSMAAERFVDIFKRLGLEKFSLNGASYQVLSVTFGIIIAYIVPPPFLFGGASSTLELLMCGLLVSGGSSAWNSVLAILKNSSLMSTITAIPLPTASTKQTQPTEQ